MRVLYIGNKLSKYGYIPTTGEMSQDVTTGRAKIMELEYELFKLHPLGVGVGGSEHYRTILFQDYHSSHNEFGRLLSEHGIFGIFIILLMLINPVQYYRKIPSTKNRAFAWMFFILFFSTVMHSAFRISIGTFFYGVSFLLFNDDENTLYRQ